MTGTVSPIAQRVAFKLDGAIAFEALLLTRLAQLPATRRQEWLRGLLVRGFERECLSLRAIQRDEQKHAKPPPTEAMAVEPPAAPQASSARPIAGNVDNVVSFASLRKVIG